MLLRGSVNMERKHHINSMLTQVWFDDDAVLLLLCRRGIGKMEPPSLNVFGPRYMCPN